VGVQSVIHALSSSRLWFCTQPSYQSQSDLTIEGQRSKVKGSSRSPRASRGSWVGPGKLVMAACPDCDSTALTGVHATQSMHLNSKAPRSETSSPMHFCKLPPASASRTPCSPPFAASSQSCERAQAASRTRCPLDPDLTDFVHEVASAQGPSLSGSWPHKNRLSSWQARVLRPWETCALCARLTSDICPEQRLKSFQGLLLCTQAGDRSGSGRSNPAERLPTAGRLGLGYILVQLCRHHWQRLGLPPVLSCRPYRRHVPVLDII
jgi:hypothetical protein